MKKIVILTATIVLFASIVYATPFLKSDCHDYVEWYELTVDSGTPIQIDAIDGSGTDVVCSGDQKRLSFDLETLGLIDGTHDVSVKAVNMWGETVDVPFAFNKQVPVTTTGIGLSLTP